VTPLVAAAAAVASINFTEGIVFNGAETFVTLLVARRPLHEIYIFHLYSTPP